MIQNAENITAIRQHLLLLIKQEGRATIADLADRLGITYEAVRQQLKQLESEKLVLRRQERNQAEGKVGRPTSYYILSPAGEHLFPKNYDELAVELIDTMANTFGHEALQQVLTVLTEARVREWEPRLRGMTLSERIEALKDIYLQDDPFMSTDQSTGELRLIEHNCPFLNIATRRPSLCSVTVSTLARLLGKPVIREERFQNGDGRCVFRVCVEETLDPNSFRFEFETDNSTKN
jgi:predicted ArsR family transcriptional regulator